MDMVARYGCRVWIRYGMMNGGIIYDGITLNP
jgi:hypothetical protein